MANPPRFLVIGAGSRGCNYARALKAHTNGVIVAVAEPHAYRREAFGTTYIAGWAETEAARRREKGWDFADWRDWLEHETARLKADTDGGGNLAPAVDGVFVCVLDHMHREVVEALAPLGVHIMCEKPLATTLEDCVAMYRSLLAAPAAGTSASGASEEHRGTDEGGGRQPRTIFSIGHVLRYSPHNMLLRKLLLQERVIGDIMSIVHTEPVGWWHFAHSYVRGHWRRTDTSAPTLLTKSCHDMDVLLWLLCSPPPPPSGEAGDLVPSIATLPHLPATVSSSGARQFFRKSRKPPKAGAATNCYSCPAEPGCKFSARKIYEDPEGKLRGLGRGNTGWPVKVVVPDIEDLVARKGKEAAMQVLGEKLREDYDAETTPDADIKARPWFGRCVFESDNDVCDEQVVTVTWDEDPLEHTQTAIPMHHGEAPEDGEVAAALRGRGAKTAVFHMASHTSRICERQTVVYGTRGELRADSRQIVVTPFEGGGGGWKTYRPVDEDPDGGHGGGDVGLTRQFVLAVDAVKSGRMTVAQAQQVYVGCTLQEVIRSHALVFAAEESRLSGQRLDWKDWWASNVEARL